MRSISNRTIFGRLAVAAALVCLGAAATLEGLSSLLVAMGIGLVAVAIDRLRPVAAPLAFFVAEELVIASRSPLAGARFVPVLWGFGTRLYEPRVLAAMVAIAGAGLAAMSAASRPTSRTWLITALSMTIGGLIGLRTGLDSGFLSRTAIDAALPWAILAAAVVTGALLRGTRRSVGVLSALAGVLIFKAGVAVLSILSPGAERAPIFFDQVVPLMAGAVLVAAALGERRSATSARWIPVSCVVILAVSDRRTALLASVGLLALVLLRRGDVRRIARTTVLVLVLIAGVRVALPTTFSTASTRVAAVLSTALGEPTDESTAGHFTDLSLGLDTALAHPLLGVGAGSSQVVGAASSRASRIYIHNDYLQVWLTGGLLAASLLVALALYAVHLGWRNLTLVRTFESAAISSFVVLVPFVVFFLPGLSATARVPYVWGIAVGWLTSSVRTPSPENEAVEATPSELHR